MVILWFLGARCEPHRRGRNERIRKWENEEMRKWIVIKIIFWQVRLIRQIG